jgi:hypothetical protein
LYIPDRETTLGRSVSGQERADSDASRPRFRTDWFNGELKKVFRSIVKEARMTAASVELELYVQLTQNIWWKYRQKKSHSLALHTRHRKRFGSEPRKPYLGNNNSFMSPICRQQAKVEGRFFTYCGSTRAFKMRVPTGHFKPVFGGLGERIGLIDRNLLNIVTKAADSQKIQPE